MKRFFSAFLRRVGRLLQPLFNPDFDLVRQSLAATGAVQKELVRQARELREQRRTIEGLERRLAESQRRGLTDISAQVERQRADISALTQRVDEHVMGRLSLLHGRFMAVEAQAKRQTEFSRRVLRQKKAVQPFVLDEQRIRIRLERMAASGRPIVAGPWTGEVGFELLYWMPFVRWFAAHYNVSPDRLHVVSRGGTRPWYADISANYWDALSFFSPAEYREATTAAKKQRQVRPFDRALLRRVKTAAGLGRAAILHPWLMYQLFVPYWRKELSLRRVMDMTHHRRLPAPDVPALRERLPERYTAVRFYFSDCFPDTPENRAVVDETVASLAEREPVVLLTPPMRVDDHYDHATAGGGRIIRIDDLMTPENNLAVQSAAISRATRFVGTYGGFAYLAPLYGVNALAFYSRRNFYTHHLELAEYVFGETHGGSLVVLDVANLDLVRTALQGPAARPLALEA